MLLARLFRPTVRIDSGENLIRLGSAYGGWTIEDAPYLRGCVAISCGLGEDASFDAEFAARYGAEVVLVDPTPRSIAHFQRLFGRIGKAAEVTYSADGCQPAEAYDLSAISSHQLRLEPMALWINEGHIRFYKPADPAHVSHSIKFQPAVPAEDQFILVPTVTMPKLLLDVPAERFALMKLDIEGAEVEILNWLPSWPILPRQILVEFDVLREPGPVSREEVERIDGLLRTYGYSCRHFDGSRNYLYVR